jgi:hypothetical protein
VASEAKNGGTCTGRFKEIEDCPAKECSEGTLVEDIPTVAPSTDSALESATEGSGIEQEQKQTTTETTDKESQPRIGVTETAAEGSGDQEGSGEERKDNVTEAETEAATTIIPEAPEESSAKPSEKTDASTVGSDLATNQPETVTVKQLRR